MELRANITVTLQENQALEELNLILKQNGLTQDDVKFKIEDNTALFIYHDGDTVGVLFLDEFLEIEVEL